MRLFLKDNNSDNINLNNIPIIKTNFHKEIYTNDGIFKLYTNNKIFKLNINDGEINRCLINNINFIYDNSEIKDDHEVFSIPYTYKIINIKENEYKFDNNSKLSYIEIYDDKKLINNYFNYQNKFIDNNLSDLILDFYK